MQLDAETQTVQNNHVQSKRFMIIHDLATKPYFSRMKRVIQHTRNCPRKKTGQQGPCSICKQVIYLMLFTGFSRKIQFIALCCYHAKRCEEKSCRIPYCSLIKTRLKQQRDLQRRRQEQLMKRRMMISLNDEPATPQPATPQPSTPKPGTPSMNGGGGKGGGGKGGSGGGKMGSMGVNSNPFSPQPNNQYNQMQNPQGQGNPPPGAVAAAQEVVDIATRQITPKPMVSFETGDSSSLLTGDILLCSFSNTKDKYKVQYLQISVC